VKKTKDFSMKSINHERETSRKMSEHGKISNGIKSAEEILRKWP
jgi:hypothetical protein